jgi:competence protein ComEC
MDGLSILFPGDIEKEVEQELVDRTIPLQSDILLAAHHGSATSNSPAFVHAVAPSAIIVSAGKSKRKIYPSAELLDLSRESAIPLYSTQTDGSIWVQSEMGRQKLYIFGDLQDNPLLRTTRKGRTKQVFD